MNGEASNAIEEVPDVEETIVEASATSHLKSVKLPESEKEASEEAVEFPEVKLPKTLKGTHEALASARNEKDVRIRRHKVKLLTDHLHALSQGAPRPDIDQADYKRLTSAQNRSAEEVQIEMLGRQFPVVKKWIDGLTAANEALTEKLNAART